jgi:hypothetical protein
MDNKSQMVLLGLSERNGIRIPIPSGVTGQIEYFLRGTSPIIVDAPLAEPSTWVLPTNGANGMADKLTECIEAMPTEQRSYERIPSGPSMRT